MKIQTVNQLISVFKDISTRHYQINGFGVGDNWENGTSEKMHPVLWINPTTATMPSSDNGYKTFEIDFEVRVFDLVNKDESNEKEVLSDCIDILKDIITEFKGHPYYVNSQLNIIDDINFEAFTEEFDEEVSGWVCEISLMTPVLTSFCGIPSAEITGFEFPGADCPDVNVLCPVFVEDVTGVYPIVVTTTGTTKEVSIVGGGLSDTFVISGEYDNGTLTLTRNDDVDVIVTGFDTGGDNDYTTSATLSGNIITFDRTDTVGAYSVDLTTAINSAPDKFVSSGAYDAINNKIVLTLNDASTVDIDTSAIGGGGGGIDNVTTAEKSALSPSPGDFVYDTDLSSLQRYDGSNWVSVSNGYGLIEVVRDSDNGIPTYFIDLQTALETCKASGSINYVKIFGNITLTSTVNMIYSGSGTGLGYLYDSLTLDLNGFTITNNQTDNSKVIHNELNGGSLNILNGSLIRTNGPGTEICLSLQHNSNSSLTLNNVTVYCENGWAGYFSKVSNTNYTTYENFCNFGGSLFISNSSNRPAIQTVNSCAIENFTTVANGSDLAIFVVSTSKVRNFKAISNGSDYALESDGEVTDFYCENTSTGGGSRITQGVASNFISKSVSSYAVNINGSTTNVTYFTAISITGVSILALSSGRIQSAEAVSGSSSYTCWIQNGGNINSVKSENTGTGNAFYLQTTQAKNPVFTDLTGIASGNSACIIKSQNASCSTSLYNSTMKSNLDTSSGHSVNITNNTGSTDISNCVLKVKNSGAYNITGITTSIDSSNNTLVGATTPINATITVNASTDLGNGNRQI